ncbi:hypothetical protein COU95_03135 [Candidatus Shapirobacteria bacterium CG10_big_fil_rev_8_21_14_0_10_40_9]|uniref:Hydrolase TatD n=1 Tax=Candidatus Shapirobacteria bacterium CG10_big_fil_rev_8_21_14_0_10_40_9 TaxID=1974888 RepID=A0A2M8L359_9BACT|nr:MAG: hypothetical protein COU95_03135 [Candidatus Shapirobacteria bacterium CG10_big_fil_rev_8_21_14_0_10_40_9]
MLIDTHAHLNFPDFEKDLNKVIDQAIQNGVEKIICVSSNLKDSQRAIEIAQKYPGIVFATVGLHPHQTDPENKQSPEKQIKILADLAKQPEVIAIGECGLDYALAPPGEKDRSKEKQFFLFQKQIELAQKLNLPIIVHSRKAFSDTLEILNNYFNQLKYPKGVFHCYSAGKSDIKTIESLGFYFGIDGNLTYDLGLQNVARQIPLGKIVLETDSPFLSPEPFRSLRNEPKNVKIVAEFLNKIKGVSFEKICQITTENAKILFKIR